MRIPILQDKPRHQLGLYEDTNPFRLQLIQILPINCKTLAMCLQDNFMICSKLCFKRPSKRGQGLLKMPPSLHQFLQTILQDLICSTRSSSSIQRCLQVCTTMSPSLQQRSPRSVYFNKENTTSRHF